MQGGSSQRGFMRHVQACNNAVLPGRRVPFRIGRNTVGWLLPELRDALVRYPRIRAEAACVTLTDGAAMPDIVAALADEGLVRLRGELFDVRAEPEGPVLATVDRGGVPVFGVRSVGIHVNGLVHKPDGLHVWVGRRSPHKRLEPNKLDHVTAGGVSAGLTPMQTLLKEAEEEASIPGELAARAVPVGLVAYVTERPEGLRRDLLHCYDLELPPGFQPVPGDDEVASFELWPIERAFEAVRDTNDFKFNVTLVLIDLFLRLAMIVGEEAAALRPALYQPDCHATLAGP